MSNEAQNGNFAKPMLAEMLFGGLDKYFEDLEKWEHSFYCNECGCDEISDFAYDRTMSSGEVWHCKRCKTETITGNKPNEDDY
jgi:hypothetical protein